MSNEEKRAGGCLCGAALSSGEVGQGYKTVMDPSVYVLFPLVDRENTSLLVWTTTPWTLPSNQFAAVNEKIEYATVYDPELDHNIVLAKDLVEKIDLEEGRQWIADYLSQDSVNKYKQSLFNAELAKSLCDDCAGATTEEDLALYAHIPEIRRRTYCAMVHRLDVNVGRIVDELRSRVDRTLPAPTA